MMERAIKAPEMTLTPAHEALLIASAINEDVAAERGYWSATRPEHAQFLRELELESLADSMPGLIVPTYNYKREKVTYQLRLDYPVKMAKGGTLRYKSPRKDERRTFFDIHPRNADKLAGNEPLWITEGVRKADAATSKGLCCIALMGVDMWQSKDVKDRPAALPEWSFVNLKGRDVFLAFDSDVMTNPKVQAALTRLRTYLTGRHAIVHDVILPGGPNGEKIGLDDYFAAGHSLEELHALAEEQPAAPPVDWSFIDDINAKFAFLKHAHYYVEETTDLFGQKTYAAHTLPELRNIFANKPVTMPGDDGPRQVNPVELWNANPKRREYMFMDLLPGVSQHACDKRGVLNMWQGWNVEPVDSPQSCNLIVKHIHDRIANGDAYIAEKILDLLAFHVQRPMEKVRIALVLRSKTQGTGKGLLGEYLRAIYGPHFVKADTQRAVLGQFNAHLAKALVLFVDEATFGGDRKAADQLKTLISEETRDLEHKGKDVNRVRNLMFLMIAGNAEHLVNVETADRRHFVVDVREERMPTAESRALIAEMRGAGPAAFLHFLMNRELAPDYNHEDVPETAARSDAKLHSLPRLERFIYEHLYNGEVSHRAETGERRLFWPTTEGGYLAKAEWFKAFEAFHKNDRYAEKVSEFYKKLAADTKRGVPLVLRTIHPRQGENKSQVPCAVLPTLDAARELFAKSCNLDVSIWNGAANAADVAEAERLATVLQPNEGAF